MIERSAGGAAADRDIRSSSGSGRGLADPSGVPGDPTHRPASGPATLRIRLLGRFSITLGSVTLSGASWRGRAAAAVLKLLALSPTRALYRDEVIDLLWPDEDPENASARLRSALHAARRALGVLPVPSQALVQTRGERLLLRWEGSEVPLEPLAPSRVLPARRPPDALLAPVPGLDRFPFRFGRDAAGRVVEVFHGPSWFRRPDHREPSPPAPDPSWGAFVGDYRSPNPWAPAFSVVLRDGRLAMVAPWLERDEELAPLGGGRFRVGAPWSPDRIRFEDVVGGEARRAVFDGAPWFRAG
uniref:OmpR/PhoB-type domain-containing protein n=1 Tax=Thermorudis peleae TaxID=1382356 RepID=A0A831TFW6_9BACT